MSQNLEGGTTVTKRKKKASQSNVTLLKPLPDLLPSTVRGIAGALGTPVLGLTGKRVLASGVARASRLSAAVLAQLPPEEIEAKIQEERANLTPLERAVFDRQRLHEQITQLEAEKDKLSTEIKIALAMKGLKEIEVLGKWKAQMVPQTPKRTIRAEKLAMQGVALDVIAKATEEGAKGEDKLVVTELKAKS